MKKKGDKMGKEEKKDTFVAVPASLGGIFLVIVVLFLLFARGELEYLVPIVWAFVLMGIFSLFFATVAYRKK